MRSCLGQILAHISVFHFLFHSSFLFATHRLGDSYSTEEAWRARNPSREIQHFPQLSKLRNGETGELVGIPQRPHPRINTFCTYTLAAAALHPLVHFLDTQEALFRLDSSCDSIRIAKPSNRAVRADSNSSARKWRRVGSRVAQLRTDFRSKQVETLAFELIGWEHIFAFFESADLFYLNQVEVGLGKEESNTTLIQTLGGSVVPYLLFGIIFLCSQLPAPGKEILQEKLLDWSMLGLSVTTTITGMLALKRGKDKDKRYPYRHQIIQHSQAYDSLNIPTGFSAWFNEASKPTWWKQRIAAGYGVQTRNETLGEMLKSQAVGNPALTFLYRIAEKCPRKLFIDMHYNDKAERLTVWLRGTNFRYEEKK